MLSFTIYISMRTCILRSIHDYITSLEAYFITIFSVSNLSYGFLVPDPTKYAELLSCILPNCLQFCMCKQMVINLMFLFSLLVILLMAITKFNFRFGVVVFLSWLFDDFVSIEILYKLTFVSFFFYYKICSPHAYYFQIVPDKNRIQ